MTRAPLAIIAALAIVAAYALGRDAGRASTLAETQARLAQRWGAQAVALLAGQDDAPSSIQQATPEAVAEPPAWIPETVAFWWPDVIHPAATRHGVDPVLAAIIVTVESGGNQHAASDAGGDGPEVVGPNDAVGLYQVVGKWHPTLWTADPFDPHHNADVGTAYLADCLRRYGVRDDPDWQRSVERAAAAYNGGGGGVANPNAETRAYVRWVGGMWRERNDAASPTYEAWLAAGGERLVDAARATMAPMGVLPPTAGGMVGIAHRPRP